MRIVVELMRNITSIIENNPFNSSINLSSFVQK